MKSGELVNMKRQHQLYSGVELVTAYINKHCCMRTNSYIKITFAPPKNAYHMLCTWLHCLLNCCKKQILFFCQMLKRCRESNITFLLKYTIDRFNNLTKWIRIITIKGTHTTIAIESPKSCKRPKTRIQHLQKLEQTICLLIYFICCPFC